MNILFPLARKIMARYLKDEDLKSSYKANIAYCIYDNSKAQMSIENCNMIAERLLVLIFE